MVGDGTWLEIDGGLGCQACLLSAMLHEFSRVARLWPAEIAL